MSDENKSNLPTIVTFKQNLTALIDRKELALPSNVSPEAFKNAAIVAVQDNPSILGCDEASIFKSIRTLAAAGLVPDGREAALVPFKSKVDNNWINKCQAMPMVFGLIKMVRRSGEVSDVRAHIVYQNEVDGGHFSYIVGDEERLEHSPILFGDKGPAVAAYAIAKLKDGNIVREFMSAAEIDVVRRSSSAQKIYAKGTAPKTSDAPIGIWKDWWTEMWKKTVIRRLCKRLDMSSEDMRRVMVEPDMESIRDVTPKEPTALQKKVAAAKSKPIVMDEEAEVLPVDEDGPHWTESVEWDQGAPGSKAWDQGMEAFSAGVAAEDCPYVADLEAAADWLGAWHGARRASE